MKNIKDVLGKRIIIGDGAMGSLLQNKIPGAFISDELNLSKPHIIEQIHHDYAKSGADFLTTNTLGASPLKLKEISIGKYFESINREAVRIARKVAEKKDIWIAGNIGSLGKLIEPLGDLTFDEAITNFSAQARILEDEGSDFILIETITDIQEFRAAVIGSLSVVKIPVIACMSFTNDDLSISGTDGRVFGVTSNFSGLSGVGSNCGSSLENMRTVIKKIIQYSDLPVLCQPNAGIPVIKKGKSVFKVKPDEFSAFMENIYKLGVSIIGSCCGSTPEFTEKLSGTFKNRPVLKRETGKDLILSTRTTIKEVSGNRLFLVGERINPTGRKKLKKELESGNLSTVRFEAREQEKFGSDALDINVNLHNLDLGIVKKIVLNIQNMVDIPLVIDSMDVEIIEEFCRLYAGKGVINSISGEKRALQTLLPLAKKYNMAFVASLIDEKGIPGSAVQRLRIAKKIHKNVEKFQIPSGNIIFDPLVSSAGAEIKKVDVTLQTLELLKNEFPGNKTIIGLSNISYGLPNRELINATFLSMALSKGLDMVIANPLHESIRDPLMVLNFLKTGSRENLSSYIDYFSDVKGRSTDKKKHITGSLFDNILEGDIEGAASNINTVLKNEPPLELINEHIMPAMNEVGQRYQTKRFFLPQLIASADVVRAILPFIKEKLPRKGIETEKKILFATVKGDIHDIGKNIVISILESFNYSIVDLGKDVPAEKIVYEAIKNKVNVIGLSTLMTTTVPSMLETVNLIKGNGQLEDVKIFIGGAVVSKRIADEVDVYFSKDGMEMVGMLKTLCL